MTKTEASKQQQDEDLEDMPELRYNQAPVVVVQQPSSTTAKTSHVVV